MSDHKHGEMNIEVQEKTFESFLRVSGYVCVGAIVALILIAFINV